ncbi:MAG: hypothetical protein A4E20_10735 [Nitrospira sp. SG-bin2]|uniref:DUF732 domain-containing protein n=1 Tax=Nitrospira cf. moscoviensis SBR1015 TaxID=96242 RepID=UPI000A0C6BF3|nr:DUF732 domain-containing protein [Nitrospira cf. moscoviensis SBR1015]OQW34487.1 MAG: hypothetical protein A4E20_10735 [Nitrospira sp. SG-bin2]
MWWLLLLLFAPIAHSESPDELFLLQLYADGITYSNAPDIIGYAHGVCAEIPSYSFPTIVSMIRHDFPSLPLQAADRLAADSILVYCPNYATKVIEDRLNGQTVH